MKLKLNKKKLKNLSKDKNALPADMTAKIGGGMIDAGASRQPSCAGNDLCYIAV